MKNTNAILVKIPADDHKALKLLADRKRGTVNGLVRSLIVEMLQREGMDPLQQKNPPIRQENGGI